MSKGKWGASDDYSLVSLISSDFCTSSLTLNCQCTYATQKRNRYSHGNTRSRTWDDILNARCYIYPDTRFLDIQMISNSVCIRFYCPHPNSSSSFYIEYLVDKTSREKMEDTPSSRIYSYYIYGDSCSSTKV